MRVTALGHAGLRVDTARATVLCDPWFSPEGAFQGSWHQYPCNEHLLSDRSLLHPTAVAISHEHLDHVDPWFLARLPATVPVVIPRYPSPALRDKIRRGGPREIIELEQWQHLEIAEGTSMFFVSEPPLNHDSAIVISGDGHVLLDLNDARLFPVQLREIREKVGGQIDVFSFQGAGASWYPLCYRYPPERARQLSAGKRAAKLGYCLRNMKLLEPVVGLPFGGPPVFLEPALLAYNDEMKDGIFPDQAQVAGWLRDRNVNTAVLLPGDVWDAGARAKESSGAFEAFSFDDPWPYIREYAARRQPYIDAVLDRHPEPTESLWPRFEDYFRRLLDMSGYFNANIGMRVAFEITGPAGGGWSVDFRPGPERIAQHMEGCSYGFRFSSRWLPPILEGRVPWEDFFLSLRFEAWRDPDLYNDHLLGLLKFADAQALSAVESFQSCPKSEERVLIHSEDRVYSISRYCPHAGNDLLITGEVLPGGSIRCLAHHYEFDLATGVCLNGACPPLAAMEVTGATPPPESPG